MALVALFIGPSVAEAYVLPAQFMVKMLAEKRKGQKIKDLSILLLTEEKSESAPFDEHLYLKQPARQRRVRDDGDSRLYVEKQGKFASGTESNLTRGKGPLTDLTATLLVPGLESFDEIGKRILKSLGAVGINTEMTSLGRDDDKVVYIIGARSWEPEKPQLWLDKLTFLPIRLIAQVKKDGSTVLRETRMMEYGSAVAGNWFPRVIEVYENGELIRRAEVTEVKLNQDLPETLFEIP